MDLIESVLISKNRTHDFLVRESCSTPPPTRPSFLEVYDYLTLLIVVSTHTYIELEYTMYLCVEKKKV